MAGSANWLRAVMVRSGLQDTFPFKDIESETFCPWSHPGSGVKDKMILKDVDGIMEPVKVGEDDLYAYIQSHKDSVDINKILERYRAGDDTALRQVQAHYLDLEGAPQSLAEMYSFVKNTTSYFEGLPLDIRKEYNFNVSEFVADIGSERFINLFSEKEVKLDQVDLSDGPLPFEPVKEDVKE